MRLICAIALVTCFLRAHAQLPPCDVAFNVSAITCPGADDGAIVVVPISGGPYNYTWSHDAALTTNSAFGLSPGFYSVLVDDGGNCESVLDTLLIEPFVAPLGTMSVTLPTCTGTNDGSITFTVDPGPYTWTWAHDPGNTSATLTGLSFGDYSAIVLGGPPPCPSIVTASIGEPGITLGGQSTYCPSDPPLIQPTFDWDFTPDLLVWDPPQNGPSFQVQPGFSGTITLTATNTTTGCVDTDTFDVTELPAPFAVMAIPDSACMNVQVVMNTLATNGDSLVWRWGSSGFSNLTTPIAVFPEGLWQPVSLQAFDAFGCGNAAEQDSIFIRPQKPAIFSVAQIPCSPVVNIVLSSNSDSCAFFIGDSLVTNDCSGFLRWDFGRYDIYDFTLYTTQPNRCDDTLALTVDVRTEPVLFLANAFTPNDDGINDRWPDRVEIPETGFELKVYDRWGILQWQSTNPLEQWDGTDMPMGVYPYTMRMRDPCQPTNEITKTGHVTVFR
ncbi:MAG: gliding motility-associated C-terminal domain-containing protein [Flavobacteriales bacterium]|nr:gliding motility-associated C-terminal domain-containing protein [Flavobacteriales bacterium]